MSEPIDRAISRLNVAAQPEDLEVSIKIMAEYLGCSKFAESVSTFEEIVKKFPGCPQFHYDLLDRVAHLEHGSMLKAAFEDAIRSQPDNYISHYGYGLIQQLGHNQTKAIEELKRVVDIAPAFASAYLHLGIAYANTGDTDTALTYVEQAKDQNNKMAEAHFMLGKLYQSINPLRAGIYFDLFIDCAYPYLAQSAYVPYARMHAEHGRKMFDSISTSNSRGAKKESKDKETCPRCGKRVEKLSVLQDEHQFQYFLCEACCLEVIGGKPFTKREAKWGERRK